MEEYDNNNDLKVETSLKNDIQGAETWAKTKISSISLFSESVLIMRNEPPKAEISKSFTHC
jgi:hypothetical protein